MMRSSVCALLIAAASAFAPASMESQRAGSVALNAEEFSRAIPFLVKPEKLDGSMPGDMGFDPMRLSDIQTDLKYARWAELKHGRIAMLAIVGIVVQKSDLHIPGAAYQTKDIFAAPGSVGWAANIQIFLAIAGLELTAFNMHYGEGEPGDYGIDGGLLKGMTAEQIAYRKEQELHTAA